MKNVLLGLIAVLLLGIFIFLGMIFMNQESDVSEEVVADSKEESSTEESSEEAESSTTDEESSSTSVEGNVEESSTEEIGETSDALNAASLEKELAKLPLTVEGEDYIIQDTRHKALYPDMLSAIIKNNTDGDLKDIVYGFVAWDKNGLPVRLKGDIDFSDGSYFYGGTGEAINVAPGETHGRDYGFGIDSDIDNIHSMKAVVASYEGFNGEEWENPLLDDFLEIYEGKRLADIEGHEDYIHYRNGSSSSSNKNSSNSVVDGNEFQQASLEIEAENFILDYLWELETAYAEVDFSYIADYMEKDTKAYNEMKGNIENNRFPNLTIFSAEVTSYSEDDDNIYLEVTSDRTNDTLDGIHTFVTGYNLIYIPEEDSFKIENYMDL